MSINQINRAVWLVNLIRRYGRLSRNQIDRHYAATDMGNGNGIARRTFFTIRDVIKDVFNIELKCDNRTFEYYLEEDEHTRNITSWLVHAQDMKEMFVNSRDISRLIFLEDIPSSRSFLNTVVDALKERHRLKFDYAPYTRSTVSHDVILEPYFIKLFKQRWYVTGRAVREGNVIKTYALDRMVKANVMTDMYEIPDTFDAEIYFKDSFGVVFTQGEVKEISIKVDARQAKYFRAVPLHHSQQEMINDTYSIFTYYMKISPDFVEELLSHGSRVTVLKPRELRLMVINELTNSLANYE